MSGFFINHRSGFITAFCGLLFLVLGVQAGLPAPAADDLSFIGAAFEISKGHGLLNPLFHEQFGTDLYLAYPPFYFYILGCWLRLFGLRTVALIGFQLACYFLSGWLLALLLARRSLLPRFSWLWACVFGGGFLCTLGTMGLRPEGCGFAAFLAGLAVREKSGVGCKVGGWLLILGSLGIAPHTLCFAAAAVAFLTVFDWHTDRNVLREWKFIILASALLWGLFVCAIGGRVTLFLNILGQNKGRVYLPFETAMRVGGWCAWGYEPTRILWSLAVLLTALVAILCLSGGWRRSAGVRWLLLAFVGLAAATGMSMRIDVSRKEIWFMAALLWSLVVVAYLIARGWVVIGIASLFVTMVATIWSERSSLSYFVVPHAVAPALRAEARALIGRYPNRLVLVDSWSARYLFDYKLPANARDWTFGRRFPDMWPTSTSDVKKNEIWIISGRNIRMISPEYGQALVPAFSFLGHSLMYYANDERITVLGGD